MITSDKRAPMENGTVILKRTFNMTFDGQTLKFWRIIGPANHPNLNSDLSLEGLREWGIIATALIALASADIPLQTAGQPSAPVCIEYCQGGN